MKTYRARRGSHLTNPDAERIGKVLHDAFGEQRVRPTDVVRTAKPTMSPIHDDFEWDNTKAGEQWRLEQARKILSSLIVIKTTPTGAERATRAYHSVIVTKNSIRERAYVPESVVWKNDDYRSQVLTAAAKEAEHAASKLEEYEELAGEVQTLRVVASAIRDKLPKAA